jgi:hypothetical protein
MHLLTIMLLNYLNVYYKLVFGDEHFYYNDLLDKDLDDKQFFFFFPHLITLWFFKFLLEELKENPLAQVH